jgi:hypothetical protein
MNVRAAVVYESMYGNTRTIAEALGDGLRSRFETSVVPVEMATPDLIATADVIAVGGPTHMHALSRPASRKTAVESAGRRSLTVDASAGGPGLREWFTALGPHPDAIGLAFDTRLASPASLTGRAARGIARRLRRCSFREVRDAGSFLVDKDNTLIAGETEKAAAWGRAFARDL